MAPPTTRIPPRPTIALRIVAPNSAACSDRGIAPPELFSIMGSSTSRGTTAMSCINNTPSAAEPNLVLSWFFSCRIFSTNALEDRLSAAPITTASSRRVMSTTEGSARTKNSRNCTPPRKGKTKKAPVQSSTCAVPMPKAYLDRLRRRSTVSSRPCSNSRKSTPNSARDSMSLRSEKRRRPAGPMTRPAARKPSTGEASSHLKRGTMPIVAKRKMSRSLPRGSRELLSPAVTREGRERASVPGRWKSNGMKEPPTAPILPSTAAAAWPRPRPRLCRSTSGSRSAGDARSGVRALTDAGGFCPCGLEREKAPHGDRSRCIASSASTCMLVAFISTGLLFWGSCSRSSASRLALRWRCYPENVLQARRPHRVHSRCDL
mmetsp:Transcript_21033/g.45578  ORF Transcript_21033/g.45578 Transcript_21033/m.45578 type:complete len:376 (+) Transcript_21033:1-1128(+)